ncbi:hypothetical protein DK872_00890 [Kosakonia sp. MH5]|nr:hypothetical protein [Kosakonia sp. MH5]
MALPEGNTCGDCAHIRRCKGIYGHTETDTYCDWSPSRWVHWMSVGEISQRWMKQFDLPLGRHVQLYGLEPDVQHIDWSGFYGPRANLNAPGVDEVVEWAKTGRGGKVYDLVKASLDNEVCSSRYGLCE